MSAVTLTGDGPDRIRVQGARGHAPPPTLKTTVSLEGDWIGEAEISYAGPNALARAKLAAEIVGERLTLRQLPVKRRLDLIGALSVFDDDGGTLGHDAPDAPEIRVRLAVSARDRRPERSLQEVLALLCCGPAGGGGQRQQVRNRIRTVSYLVPRDRVTPRFVFA